MMLRKESFVMIQRKEVYGLDEREYPTGVIVTACNNCPGKTAKKRVGAVYAYYCAQLQQYRVIDPTTIPADCPLSVATP
jgi:hypothetical protein